MSNVGLMYVGTVLFLNGYMLLGKIDKKSAGIFNLFVGALQVFTPIYLIVTANGDTSTILSASGLFLFGFTYLYVGITNLTNTCNSGVGYYSLWVAILAIGFACVNYFHLHDISFTIIWLMWSFLGILFYLLLAKRKDIETYTGWVAIIQSWVTATIPAFLCLTGIWQQIDTAVIVIVEIGFFFFFIVLYFILRRKNEQ
ncbi:AmiS/UreI family transporter [Bacillus mycoides]|uniref:AmiS/UreI family transporter n=1 Tax=Bacillus mycoides TaxID=1405 RepID=UPI001C01810C|nr:AmiS/UreI family transporter [Bacillus mycoides]QWI48381.1 transporter [Bacillus mycoides]